MASRFYKRKFIWLLAVLVYIVNYTAADCNMSAHTCIKHLTQEDCPRGHYLDTNSTVSGCCSSCQPSAGMKSRKYYAAPYNRLPDGQYAPVQCKGDAFTGRCFCTDAEGKRIFGQMWKSQADEMTCACSRRRAELEGSERNDVTLHCTRTGDYEPLQCDAGLCWCAEPRTGQPLSLIVNEEDMTLLPCYSAALVGEQYLRRCESIVHSLALIHKEQSEHGTTFLRNTEKFCDYDGSYGAYQLQNGVLYCTDRDGKILGAWQALLSENASMNCNCALDTMVYFPEHGMSVTEVCTANGNYRPNQRVGDMYYCVDSDGYPTTDFLEEEDHCASNA